MNKTKPSHYPVDLLALAADLELDPYQTNALKYLCRAGRKEGETYTDDIGKAIEVLQMALKRAREKANPDYTVTWMQPPGNLAYPDGKGILFQRTPPDML